MLPSYFAGLVIDRGKITAQRSHSHLVLPAQPHSSARIGFGEVIHSIGFFRGDIHQPRIRTVSRRHPVCSARVVWGDQRTGNRGILHGVANGLALLIHGLRPIRRLGEFSGDQMLARHSVKRIEVAVTVGVDHHLAGLTLKIPIDQNRRLSGVPIVRVVWVDLVVPRHLARIHVDCHHGARV